MNNLEKRIREHYIREDHPSVFELLDEAQSGTNPINVRYVKSLEAENARLLTAIEGAPCLCLSKVCRLDCWKPKALEKLCD